MDLNALTEKMIRLAIQVQRALGAGLLGSACENEALLKNGVKRGMNSSLDSSIPLCLSVRGNPST